jgi:hypothetical protein
MEEYNCTVEKTSGFTLPRLAATSCYLLGVLLAEE